MGNVGKLAHHVRWGHILLDRGGGSVGTTGRNGFELREFPSGSQRKHWCVESREVRGYSVPSATPNVCAQIIIILLFARIYDGAVSRELVRANIPLPPDEDARKVRKHKA